MPILRRFLELHNHYKILILEPIKDKFNHTKRRIHKGISNEDLMHFGSLNWILQPLNISQLIGLTAEKMLFNTMKKYILYKNYNNVLN